jgi:hypothetical protein
LDFVGTPSATDISLPPGALDFVGTPSATDISLPPEALDFVGTPSATDISLPPEAFLPSQHPASSIKENYTFVMAIN